MPVLNIRNFPPDLQKALKLEAARQGTTLRDVVIQKLGGEPQGLALRGHLHAKRIVQGLDKRGNGTDT